MTEYQPGLTGNVTLIGTRFNSGTRNNDTGRYCKGIESPLSFSANHQPVTDRELQLLPEGERVKQVRKIYTPTELKTADVKDVTSADEIIIDGETFKVIRVKKYNMGVLDHFKVILSRKPK